VKTWSALLLVAAFAAFAPRSAMADDAVIARVNGVEIKQSDLDYAATEIGSRLGNYTPQDRKKVLLQYVIENELMAGAGQTDNLDKTDTFPGRVKYHERRALRDAFFDVKIHDAVSEADAKKIYDSRRSITNKETFNLIVKCLHTDTRKHIGDEVVNDAFVRFMALEKYLLNEKDSPTKFTGLPTTAAEWEQRKQEAAAIRRAKRGHSNVGRRA